MPKSLILSHPLMLKHGIQEHPENSDRLNAILTQIEQSPLKDQVTLDFERFASQAELSQVHGEDYIKQVFLLDGKFGELDYETILSPDSVRAAQLAAGFAIELVNQVVSGKVQNGFALVRPPGHHARAHSGMGFCIFNNIAIAAKEALHLGVQRILILDWDVHHGNGTQEVFYDDDRVLFIDIHQENLFPKNSGYLNEIGHLKGIGYTINVPLPDSCRSPDYLYVFDRLVTPFVLKFKPELILVSAGFDAHEDDPHGSMLLDVDGFGELVGRTKLLSKQVCDEKVIFFLEGGYNPRNLAQDVLRSLNVLVAESTDTKEVQKSPKHPDVLDLVQKIYDLHQKAGNLNL